MTLTPSIQPLGKHLVEASSGCIEMADELMVFISLGEFLVKTRWRITEKPFDGCETSFKSGL
jgi:hypothetical protein